MNPNDPVKRTSAHYEAPPLSTGGFIEIVGGREMLRLADELETKIDNRVFVLTEHWQPGNFDKALYK